MEAGFVVQAVGDVGLMGRILTRIRAAESDYPFGETRALLGSGDVLFGNLEIPFLPEDGRGRNPAVPETFVSTVDAADRLVRAGFDVLSLANNHVMDHGDLGLRTTMEALTARGIRFVGAGENLQAARRPTILETKGVRLGFLAYAISDGAWAGPDTPGVAPMSEAIVEEDLTALRDRVDVVVLSFHYGLMYTDFPQPADQQQMRRWIDRGANLIFGHHPHVCQGVEEYRAGLIAYSLGEFVFDPRAGEIVAKPFLERRADSMVLECRMEGDRLRSWRMTPIRIGPDLAPRPPDPETARRIETRWKELSEPLRGDGLKSVDVDAHVGDRLVGYQVQGILHLLRNFRLLELLGNLLRIRGRHLRFLWGWVRHRWRGAA